MGQRELNAEGGLRPVGTIKAYAPEGNAEVREAGIGNAESGITEGVNGYDGEPESGFTELKRVEVPSLPLSERHAGFREVERCFTDEQIKEETYRCLLYDLEIWLAKEAGCIQKT